MDRTHKHHMEVLLAATLALVMLACTSCVPVREAQENKQATAEAEMTQDGIVLPMTAQADMEQVTSPSAGTVTGKICYPSEGIPPMTIYAYNQTIDLVLGLDHTDGSQQYTFGSLPLGDYVFFAYTNFGGTDELSGGYTEYVNNPEGPHNLIPVTVGPGETVSGVDICDWYALPGESDIPPRP